MIFEFTFENALKISPLLLGIIANLILLEENFNRKDNSWSVMMKQRHAIGIVISLLTLIIVFTSQSLTYDTNASIHSSLRHFYYIPIIFSGYFIGLRVSISMIILSSLGFLYHDSMMGNLNFSHSGLEIMIFVVVGVLIGFLSDNERKKTRILEKSWLHFLRALSNLLDKRDTYTEGHSQRVAIIAYRIGAKLGLNKDELRSLYESGLLHDIGKLGIPDSVLKKEGALSDEEREIIRSHCHIGESMLHGVEIMSNLIPGIKHHHERYDGKGYPDGITKGNIPLFARILAIADSFDAMTSQRVYNRRMSSDSALSEILENSGRQFDPEIVRIFSMIFDKINKEEIKSEIKDMK
ncbi:MAG TPA: HD domain-containing protein [Spirochaetota bacterium]|mgnify:CR=1 FL=1|nr:HD domain-containing protein [Spirochaetota bacterium]HQE59584.1 HD domain-containing protein [Spirochaetota bacterium]